MTKQLPQEIRTAVLKVAMAFTKNIEDVEEAVFTINHYLGVYLSLPQQEEPKQIDILEQIRDEVVEKFDGDPLVRRVCDTMIYEYKQRSALLPPQ